MKGIMELPKNLLDLSANLESDFKDIKDTIQRIKQKLQKYADGKQLKGEEITGWLGEIYGKMILNGKLVPDEYDYDVETQDKFVSIKARKGTSGSWQVSSIIPRIIGAECPTHLMFIQFTDDYLINKIWLFPWEYLRDSGRFIEKMVRGSRRGYYIRVKPSMDSDYLIYP